MSTLAYLGIDAGWKGAGAEVKRFATQSDALLGRCRICIGLSQDVERYHIESVRKKIVMPSIAILFLFYLGGLL